VNRAQRNTHRFVWWILAPLLVAVVAWAVVDRWAYPEAAAAEPAGSTEAAP